MSLAFLDTQILVWGIKKECTAGQEEMIERAEYFLKRLGETGDKVAVSAVVFGEMLLRVPIAEHQRAWNEFTRDFIVIPYDGPAALAAARIGDPGEMTKR
ncbi:MAG TPA: hypothetical protein VN851_18040 [Thermoanaerobaculia bacterium]|nr:hypothetical protein [Thermoanaerobaculia bacterium]